MVGIVIGGGEGGREAEGDEGREGGRGISRDEFSSSLTGVDGAIKASSFDDPAAAPSPAAAAAAACLLIERLLLP